MIKLLNLSAMMIIFTTSLAFAHHPAADMVDEEIYAEIDALVADTPHADLEFDEEMDETIISTDSVSVADDLISDGLLDDVSLLDGEVSITIEFPEEEESLLKSIESLSRDRAKGNDYKKKWSDWGRPVRIRILQIKD